jgi:hypothetical protein
LSKGALALDWSSRKRWVPHPSAHFSEGWTSSRAFSFTLPPSVEVAQ